MITLFFNNKLSQKIILQCSSNDSIITIKKLISLKIGVCYKHIQIYKNSVMLRDSITLKDYEIHDGASLEIIF
uniref:Ubiquitin-like protein modifier n=1 Tax=Lotharella vacuolata TaxID=74820 RepID=A0A0H5BLB4_9EUKA|nr:ubiquitin-like protein modifier [Lotharella vacuolata]